ncbi:MAG: YicC/YloC family endoribonuclease [Pseudomonadota bacterium]
MTLKSMTGFARAIGESEAYSWVWEMRSVNGKGLDMRFRLPQGFEAIEVQARNLAQKTLHRGNVQIAFQPQQKQLQQSVSINEKLVDELLVASRELQKKIGGELPAIADLLSIKGVVEAVEVDSLVLPDDEVNQMLSSFQEVLDNLVEARSHEGSEIGKVLLAQVTKIEAILEKIEKDPSRELEAIRANLSSQVERLVAESEGFDEQRLHQEAAILATKADIQEELDRLKVHVGSARKLLSGGEEPVGRKLDFLAQEFNRECNTICSKSNSASVTALGLDMKLVIDQFREQLQNME